MPPTINRTISFSILVYAWSIGAMLLIGWVTKVTEYKSAITIKKRIRVTASTTMLQTLTSISSVVRFNFVNFFLQDRCD